MGVMNLNTWNKSYMLEFLKGGTVQTVFTFSVPPESEEFTFSARISETKTFGGSVFDLYGNDCVKIVLSGSTVNEELKLIYRGNGKIPDYFSGEKEVFELQKIIKEYNEIESNSGEKSVYLYDLSKMNIVERTTGTASKNYWKVFIKDFKIKRDKSKPFTFSYTLEMLGVEDNAKKAVSFFKNSKLNDVANNFKTISDNIQKYAEYTEGAVALCEEVVSKAVQVKKIIEELRKPSSIAEKVTKISTTLDGGLRLLTGNTNNTFYKSSKDIFAMVEQCVGLFNGTLGDKLYKTSSTEITSFLQVQFVSNGGTSVKPQKVEYCDTVGIPEAPVKDRYTFDGWYLDADLKEPYNFNNEVSKNLTLYASWKLCVATVTFNSKNGNSIAPLNVSIGQCVNIPVEPKRDGYKFVCWCTDFSATKEYDFLQPVTEDLTLYAKWTTAYNVLFDTDGGSKVESQLVCIGERVIYPLTPEKEDCTFTCWCTDEERTKPFDFSTAVTEDLILYAVFSHSYNEVVFVSNGGTFVEKQRVLIGDFAEKVQNPQRDGYNFVYWCLDSSLTNEFNFKTPITSSVTLYAKWQLQNHLVTFDSKGGSTVNAQQVLHDSLVIFPAIPKKEQSVFIKWEQESECGFTEYDFSKPVKKDLVLYAKYLEREKDVK